MRCIVMSTFLFETTTELETFISDFEACRVPKSRWTHQAHLVVGFWYLTRHGAPEALEMIRNHIRRHNEAVGTPNTDSSGYHETITQLYLLAIAAHIAQQQGKSILESLTALLASPLGSSTWPLSYYSRGRLFSTEARRRWLEPDLLPLGAIGTTLTHA